MNIRFVTPNQHGIGDYVAASTLIVLPFILGLGKSSPLAICISVGMGAFLIAYSLFTRYRLGVVKCLPFRGHLAIDLFDAIVFAVSPLLFGFTGVDLGYYLVVAAGVIVIVVVTLPEQPRDRVWR